MKKSLLLLVAGAITMSASAQNARPTFSSDRGTNSSYAKKTVTANPGHVASRSHSAERTTSTCTFTEDFHTGTYTTLPTGWTAGTLSGPGTWHWANVASGSMYSIGPINSTTASNGWMIFDSDSLAGGTGTGTVVPSGWLQSPLYNCATLATVRLTFEEYYEKSNDSCKIQISTTPTFTAGTTTTYQIPVNEALASNSSTANPATIHLNISSAAAMQPAVYIRFVYYGPPAGGYSWMIDDICIGPLDAHDVGIAGSFMYEPNCIAAPGTGAYDGSVFNTPLAFVDTFYPVTQLSNYGSNAEPTVVVNATLTGGPATFTPAAITYTGLPVNAFDSVVQFDGYLPTTTGSYSCVFNTTVTGDADATNNNDTVSFNITDTTWQENLGSVVLNGGYYVSRATPALSVFQGTRFDVPCGATPDTVSGFGVAFASSSASSGAGKVILQLYSVTQADMSWTYVGSSVARSVSTSDFCTSTSLRYADFRIDQSQGLSTFILQPGTTYAAMIQIQNVTTDLIVCTTTAPNATGFAGYFGQSGTSSNDGGSDFGATTMTGSTSYVPMIRLYTGHVVISHVGVQNVTLDNNIGQAFPNPTNSDFTVPFTMGQDNKVTVTLTDVMGQVLNTQTVNAIGGQAAKAVFNTSDLATGMYIYTVQANGVNTTGRIVVSH